MTHGLNGCKADSETGPNRFFDAGDTHDLYVDRRRDVRLGQCGFDHLPRPGARLAPDDLIAGEHVERHCFRIKFRDFMILRNDEHDFVLFPRQHAKWRGQLFGCDRAFDERQIQCRKILHDFLSIPGCHIHVNARIVGLEPHHVLRQVIAGDGHRRTDAQGAGVYLLQPANVVLYLAVVAFHALGIFEQAQTRGSQDNLMADPFIHDFAGICVTS